MLFRSGPEPVTVVAEDPAVDFAVCPIKLYKFGKRWEEFSNEELQAIWQSPEVTEDHKLEIVKVVEARKAVAK